MFLNRDLDQQLKSWKAKSKRKPLVLQGARQVGKTSLLKEFGERTYESLIYLNFEKDKKIKKFFEDNLNPQEIIRKLSIYLGRDIIPQATLLFFDEIQESNEALNSLKYFNEEAPEYHVACAGSLLGVKLKNKKTFPVGQVDFISIYPLSFYEFLEAIGKLSLRRYLEEQDLNSLDIHPFPQVFHDELIELLKIYYFVGGMPEAVAHYAETKRFEGIREIQENILNAYRLDFSKHAAPQDILKIGAVFESIPRQLARENKKFIFSVIKKSARAREYENALQWLVDAGLVYKNTYLSCVKFPLKAYAECDVFKIFLLDVGLLGAMTDLDAKILLEGHQLFQEFKGSFAENYVAQELKSSQGSDLYYWASEGKAEVDFVISQENRFFPLEVKSGVSRGIKSLHVYEQSNPAACLLRVSVQNFSKSDRFYNIPLYAVPFLKKLTGAKDS